jgi:cephalosporin-C deacetylase-like acetyl esterase
METLMSFFRSTGPWYVDGRTVRQKLNPEHIVAQTYKYGDTQLIAAAPEMAAALKMVLAHYDHIIPPSTALIACAVALEKAGEL